MPKTSSFAMYLLLPACIRGQKSWLFRSLACIVPSYFSLVRSNSGWVTLQMLDQATNLTHLWEGHYTRRPMPGNGGCVSHNS